MNPLKCVIIANKCECACVQFAQGEYGGGGLDLNIMPVWCLNVTGDGVVVSIVDDGESSLSLRTATRYSTKHKQAISSC